MQEGVLVTIMAAVVGLIVFRGYKAYIAKKKRPLQLRALADQLHWRFDPNLDKSHDGRYGHFAVFAQGHSRCAFNTFQGAVHIDGRRWPVRMGDYRYRITSGGKQSTTVTYCLSYMIIKTPYQGLPDLCIRREKLSDRFASMMGFEDIDFESAEFSERFHVMSSDKRFAYAALDPRMMEFLLESDPPAIEIRRGECCLIRGQTWWTAEQFQATVNWARDFLAHWPRHISPVLDS
jgi:Protein of unknown function (DUF3137)